MREPSQGLFQALNRESWLKRGCGWRRKEGGSFWGKDEQERIWEFEGDSYPWMFTYKVFFQMKMNQQGMIISAWVNILEELVTISLSKELSIIEPSQIWMFVMNTMSITTLPRHRPDLRIGLRFSFRALEVPFLEWGKAVKVAFSHSQNGPLPIVQCVQLSDLL